MNKKHFVFIEDKQLTKKEIAEIERTKQRKLKKHAEKIAQLNAEKITQLPKIRHTNGRVVISINLEAKNSHTFSNGQKIYIGRQFNNLNRRETEPVNAFVVSAENIPAGVEILIHPNAIQDSHKIFGFSDDISDVKYYSVPENLCYIWKSEEGEWQPLKGFATGLRVFEEYTGPIIGVDHKKIDNVLYITSGEYKDKVVHTLKACDYEIIFMGDKGIEERVIRCRHFENEINEREEIVGVDEYLTKKIEKKELMVGVSSSDAKYIIFTL